MKSLVWTAALSLLAVTALAGNLYKWVDKDGKVHYTDQPPPPDAKTAERKKLGDQASEAQLPYSLQMAMKNFPVTLFNSDCPDACAKATALLAKRGVPFTDRMVNDAASAEELKALTGGKLQVPVLKVGQQVVNGFEEGEWNATLDAAGYPRTPVAGARSRAPAKPKTDQTAPAETAPAPKTGSDG